MVSKRANRNQIHYTERFRNVCEKLQNDGKAYPKERLQHFRILIRRVTKAAEEAGVCADILWGTIYATRNQKEDSESIAITRQRRSLTEKEEVSVYECLMRDPGQSGQKMGLALMFSLGLRNNEACGLDFGDIRPMVTHPECSCAFIYKTTERGGRVRKDSGKSRNAVRIIPIPEALSVLLHDRRERITKAIQNGEFSVDKYKKEYETDDISIIIDRLPIACSDLDYDKPLLTNQLSMAAKHMFRREIRMNEGLMRQIDSSLSQETEDGAQFIEKDATAYLLRRNFGTRLYHLGLSEPEIQYVIGHNIETMSESRDKYRNEEKLYPVYLKMNRRFLVNRTDPADLLVEEDITTLQNITKAKLRVPIQNTRQGFLVAVRSNDADCQLRIRINTSNAQMTAHLLQRPNSAAHRDPINITELARKRYDSAIKSSETEPEGLREDAEDGPAS